MQEIVILSLVVLSVMRVWFLSSIFARRRSYWQTRGGWLSELLSCPLCLSYHLSFWPEVLLLLPFKLWTGEYLLALLSPVYGLAAGSLAFTIWYWQYPRYPLE